MQVIFNPHTGMISLNTDGLPEASSLIGSAWVSYRDESGNPKKAELVGQGCSNHEDAFIDVHGNGKRLTIHCPPNPQGIELIYRIHTYAEQSFNSLQLGVRNLSRGPIYLQAFCLFHADQAAGGQVGLFEHADELRFFKVGWHGWDFTGLRTAQERNTNSRLDAITSSSYTNMVTPRIRRRGEFWSEGWGMLAGDQAAVVAGFTSTARQFGQVYANTNQGKAALMLSTQADGILLEPGRILRIGVGVHPDRTLAQP